MDKGILRYVGTVFCILAGFVLGYAFGIQTTYAQIANLISNAVSTIAYLSPLIGPAIIDPLSNGVSNYIMQKVTSAPELYYVIGIVMFIVGLGLVALGKSENTTPAGQMRNLTVSTKARIFASQSTETTREQEKFCRFCGNKIKADTVYCLHCGRSVE